MVGNLVAKMVLTAAQVGIGMLRRVEGPKQTDLTVTVGDYNAPWTRVWGTRWIRPPVIWAKDLEEVRRERKTKGGKYNDYTYFGSCGLGLARHQLAQVRRIKLDGHLVLDLSGVGPVTPFALSSSGGGKGGGGGGGGTMTDYFRFLPGTLTQGVDPAIEAAVEAEHGEGSCPAYLGRAIGVIDSLPLEKFGNRLPQAEFELVSVMQGHMPSETFTPSLAVSPASWRLSADGSRLAWVNGGGYCIWDVAARAEMTSGSLPLSTPSASRMGVFNDGRMIWADLFGGDLYTTSPDGATVQVYLAPPVVDGQGGAWVVADGNEVEHWGGYPSSFYSAFAFDGVAIDYGWKMTHVCADVAGNVWVCGHAGTTLHFARMVTLGSPWPAAFSITMPDDPGGNVFAVAGNDRFLVYWGGDLYLVDPAAGTATYSATSAAVSASGVASAFANVRPGATTLWLVNQEYAIDTGLLVRTVSLPADPGLRRTVYSQVLHALIANDYGLSFYYLDRLDAPEAQLGDIVRDVCLLACIAEDEIDVSALTQTVPGYSVTSGTGRDWLEPLLELYDVDARPHGFGLQFVPRGGALGATILADQMARSDEGAPLFGTTGPGGTDVPRQVTLAFADVATDQQPGSASAPPRFDVDGQRVQTIGMESLALGADEARQLITRFDRRQRFDAHGYTFALPASQLALEPADRRPLDLRGVTVNARLHSLALQADRRIVTEWRRDEARVALLDGSTGATADGQGTATIAYPGLSRGFVLDLPLLRDADASVHPLLYGLAAPWSAGGTWPGATIYQAIDGEYSEELVSIAAGSQATWGTALSALPTSLPTVWDRASALAVRLKTGTLTGCTEADIEANPRRNLCALKGPDGWELLQFTTPALQGDGSWILTGLLRGRRGTEQHVAGHAVNDLFVLLDSAALVAMGLDEVTLPLSFKAITAGRSADGSFPIDLTFTGASLKPYSPVHPTALRDTGTGDWVLGWTRRTRTGGGWTDGADVPLGETSEIYEVEIMDGATVKRTFTGLTSPTVTYTAAQQTTDFGAPLTSAPARRIYQISDAVGRGFAVAA